MQRSVVRTTSSKGTQGFSLTGTRCAGEDWLEVRWGTSLATKSLQEMGGGAPKAHESRPSRPGGPSGG